MNITYVTKGRLCLTCRFALHRRLTASFATQFNPTASHASKDGKDSASRKLPVISSQLPQNETPPQRLRRDSQAALRFNTTEASQRLMQNEAEEKSSQRARTKLATFTSMICNYLDFMRSGRKADFLQTELCLHKKSDEEMLRNWIAEQLRSIKSWVNEEFDPKNGEFAGEWQHRLWKVFVKHGRGAVYEQLRYAFQDYRATRTYTRRDIVRQSQFADLRHPAEWWHKARKMDREIHLHIGPTNSGKTYHALQRLQRAKRGVYAGPLRLLAHEVHGRMLAAGRSCNMVTGDEQILSDDPECGLVACTVEMAPSAIKYDVAVVDEIQMIADDERGWAWTEAFFGLRAKELHLCGEARSLPLIEKLAIACGDKLVVHRYERLTPLKVDMESLGGDLNALRPGDCVVAFSRGQLHDLRYRIHEATGKNVAIVYGSLPPEIRAEQARLFNDPDSGYDILVASNAIGMGLNLSIKRIIFWTRVKYNGEMFVDLSTTEVQQIGGRAGRYRSSFQSNIEASAKPKSGALSSESPDVTLTETATTLPAQSVGLITSMKAGDLAFFEQEMVKLPEPIQKGRIQFPDKMIARFASYFPPDTPLTYVLHRLADIARHSEHFELADQRDRLDRAAVLSVVQHLDIEDRLIFCAAPAKLENVLTRRCLLAMAVCAANSQEAELFDLPVPLELLDTDDAATPARLKELEVLHECLTLYLWLSFRFPSIFTAQPLANHARGITEQRISATLTALAQSGQIKKSQNKAEVTGPVAVEPSSKNTNNAGPREQQPGDGVARMIRSQSEERPAAQAAL